MAAGKSRSAFPAISFKVLQWDQRSQEDVTCRELYTTFAVWTLLSCTEPVLLSQTSNHTKTQVLMRRTVFT